MANIRSINSVKQWKMPAVLSMDLSTIENPHPFPFPSTSPRVIKTIDPIP